MFLSLSGTCVKDGVMEVGRSDGDENLCHVHDVRGVLFVS